MARLSITAARGGPASTRDSRDTVMTASDPELKQGMWPGEVLDEDTFRQLLSLEANRAIRYRDFFVLCLLQPDQASSKDQTGEMLGQRVARKIVDFVRFSDIVGSLGDGIGVLLLQTADALHVTERLRSEIGNVRFQAEAAGDDRKITLSVGEISFPGGGHSEISLLSRARARLEEAVRSGGDRVVQADHSEALP
jgi:diguanylate cyclase (GGDEF)-like protein